MVEAVAQARNAQPPSSSELPEVQVMVTEGVRSRSDPDKADRVTSKLLSPGIPPSDDDASNNQIYRSLKGFFVSDIKYDSSTSIRQQP